MILMYHHVSPLEEIPEDAARRRAEGWDFHTAPETLGAHLEFLRKQGKTVVSLSEYVEELRLRGAPLRGAVAVTFDDGWQDNPVHALPVLVAAGVSATFFLVTGEVEGVAREAFADEEGVRALLSAGMEIGGHTRTHRGLARLSPDEARDEILGSRDDLELRYGTTMRHFAYPGGNFNSTVARIVREEAGFDSACCVLPGMRNDASRRYWLSRETPGEPWGRRARVCLTNPAVRTWIGLRSVRRLKRILSTDEATSCRIG